MRLIDTDALLTAYEDAMKELVQATNAENISLETLSLLCGAKLIAEAPTIGGWISVKDMIPEMYKAVLGYAPYHHNIWAVTMHENGEWYIWSPQSKRYDPDWEGPITHWMQMPEPPEEVTG